MVAQFSLLRILHDKKKIFFCFNNLINLNLFKKSEENLTGKYKISIMGFSYLIKLDDVGMVNFAEDVDLPPDSNQVIVLLYPAFLQNFYRDFFP